MMALYITLVGLSMLFAAVNCLIPALIAALLALGLAFRPELHRAKDRLLGGPRPGAQH